MIMGVNIIPNSSRKSTKENLFSILSEYFRYVWNILRSADSSNYAERKKYYMLIIFTISIILSFIIIFFYKSYDYDNISTKDHVENLIF